ncbi:DUF3939 domain-containing protein [Bacillus sp. FJAT-45350]|uniref:DUF3939 domain-containing protein n=1 Tax=Bacillus sp. FJAT-45350 TaxID=2011014 RepID=UPI000BB8EE76|nr:DUF3939 domain-containing protein [Bacillus sp. FJAT-45350]
MFPWKKKKKKEEELPAIDVSLDEVRQAVKDRANSLPLGVSLRTYINDDHSINFDLLKPNFKGIPNQTFYMSKETFEIFEDQVHAQDIDRVQKAVDQFVSETGEYPVIDGPDRQISYFRIKEYLHEQPKTPLYLDAIDNMVTYRRPNS